MADQKVRLKPPPPEPVVSRPLKTGANFILVLPKKRFVYRHWDKEKYLPDEEGEMIMEGEGITSDEKYEFIVEKADSEGGPWSEVTTLKAAVQGDKATARYKFPKPPKKGHLTKVEWKRSKAKPGEQLGMHIEATDYEGGFLSIHVEKQQPGGEWDVYCRWQGEIEQGKHDTVFLIPKGNEKPGAWKAGKVVELSFDGNPTENKPLFMVAKTEGFDGSSLQFVLERTDENGNWTELGSAVSTVKDNGARNSINVPPFVKITGPGEAAPEGHVAIKFGKNVFHKGEELVVWVDPKWLEGKGFEVTMERRVMDDKATWEEVAVVDAEGEAQPEHANGEEQPPPAEVKGGDKPAPTEQPQTPAPAGKQDQPAEPAPAQAKGEEKPAEPEKTVTGGKDQAHGGTDTSGKAGPGGGTQTGTKDGGKAQAGGGAQAAPAGPGGKDQAHGGTDTSGKAGPAGGTQTTDSGGKAQAGGGTQAAPTSEGGKDQAHGGTDASGKAGPGGGTQTDSGTKSQAGGGTQAAPAGFDGKAQAGGGTNTDGGGSGAGPGGKQQAGGGTQSAGGGAAASAGASGAPGGAPGMAGGKAGPGGGTQAGAGGKGSGVSGDEWQPGGPGSVAASSGAPAAAPASATAPAGAPPAAATPAAAAAGAGKGSGGPSAVQVGAVVAGVAVAGAALAGGVALASDSKDKSGSNPDETNVEE